MDAPGHARTATAQPYEPGPPHPVVLDCRGLLCPLPLLKTQQALASLPEGQVLEVWSTDPGTELNVRAWAQGSGYQVASLPPQDGVYRFHVRRSAGSGR
ncbi:MAG: sulfurtransferase TusA family protein [bacterium]